MAVQIPQSVAVLVLLTDLVLAVLVLVGSVRAARLAGLSTGVRRRVGVSVAVVLTVWLALAFTVAQAQLSTRHLLVLGLIGGPVVLGYGLLAVSSTWRRVVRAVPQTWLVGGQFYRTIGAVFLVLWAGGSLPAFFALPAGVGDIVTGVGGVAVAVLIARRVRWWQPATVGWNLFGLADLVVAVGAGSTLLAGPLSTVFAAEVSTEILVWFPLGMIPLFLVPISVLLHLYSLTNLHAERSAAGTPQESESRIERAWRSL